MRIIPIGLSEILLSELAIAKSLKQKFFAVN